MNRATLADAFGHHAWATVRVIDACRDLDSQQLETSVPGTFGTVLETLRHLVGADASYLSVLDGRDGILDEESLDLEALRSLAVDYAAAWTTLLSGELDEEAIVVRHRDDGSESHAPMSIRLAQALHHGTDHRSQICTTITSLGLEPPLIDVWSYAWDNDRLWEIPAPG